MRIINPSYKIEQCPPYHVALSLAECAARTCYKSEDKIDDGCDECQECKGKSSTISSKQGGIYLWKCDHCDGTRRVPVRDPSAVALIRSCISRHHESVIEHIANISVRFICDRGVSHELVRHRLASFSQESTRYCNYSGDKFGQEITVIKPVFWRQYFREDKEHGLCIEAPSPAFEWDTAMRDAEKCYFTLLANGASPQEASSVLPNSLKTEIVMTANIREWRLIFKLRTSKAAHPQMRELMVPLLKEMQQRLPVFFEDINLAETE